jgi:hypothetical protein
MAIYKIPKNPDQNIVDICTNYASMDKIYDFLEANQIDYSFAGALESDFITLDDTWITPKSQYLINNKNVVVTGDEPAFYPTTNEATAAAYSKNIQEDFRFANTGDTWAFEIDFRNYGYATDDSNVYIFIKTGDTMLYSANYNTTNEYGELITLSASTTIPSGKTVTVETMSEYAGGSDGQLYGGSDITTAEGWGLATGKTSDNMFFQYATGTLTLTHSAGYTGTTYLYNQDIGFLTFTPQLGDSVILSQIHYYTTTSGWTFYLKNSNNEICSNVHTLPIGNYQVSEYPDISLVLDYKANGNTGIDLVLKYAGGGSGAQFTVYAATTLYTNLYRTSFKDRIKNTLYT